MFTFKSMFPKISLKRLRHPCARRYELMQRGLGGWGWVRVGAGFICQFHCVKYCLRNQTYVQGNQVNLPFYLWNWDLLPHGLCIYKYVHISLICIKLSSFIDRLGWIHGLYGQLQGVSGHDIRWHHTQPMHATGCIKPLFMMSDFVL